MAKTTRLRITCGQNPNGAQPGVYFANIWGKPDRAKYRHGGPVQLGHGSGSTRALAIAAAKLNAQVAS